MSKKYLITSNDINETDLSEIISDTYDAESSDAMSGKAVASALDEINENTGISAPSLSYSIVNSGDEPVIRLHPALSDGTTQMCAIVAVEYNKELDKLAILTLGSCKYKNITVGLVSSLCSEIDLDSEDLTKENAKWYRYIAYPTSNLATHYWSKITFSSVGSIYSRAYCKFSLKNGEEKEIYGPIYKIKIDPNDDTKVLTTFIKYSGLESKEIINRYELVNTSETGLVFPFSAIISASGTKRLLYKDLKDKSVNNLFTYFGYLNEKGEEVSSDSSYLTCNVNDSSFYKVDKSAIDYTGITSQTYEPMFGGEFTVTTVEEEGYLSPHALATVTGRISKHYTYRITINGTQYILPCDLDTFVENGFGFKCYEYLGKLGLRVSDTSYITHDLRNVPFLIVSDLNSNSSIDVFTDTAGTYTILVEKIVRSGEKLPNYLLYEDDYFPFEFKKNEDSTYNGTSIGSNSLLNSRGTIAIGYANTCSAGFAQAIGNGCTASGEGSHAEGAYTTASGTLSHTEGAYTLAENSWSHAGGFRTKTAQSAQTVIGYGNNPQTDSIFEIGNGLDANGNAAYNTTGSEPATRQNAFRVTQDGKAIAQTDVQLADGTSLSAINQNLSITTFSCSNISSNIKNSTVNFYGKKYGKLVTIAFSFTKTDSSEASFKIPYHPSTTFNFACSSNTGDYWCIGGIRTDGTIYILSNNPSEMGVYGNVSFISE